MKNRLYESKDEQLFSEIRKLKEGSSGDYNAVYELSNKYLYKIVNDIVKNQDDTEDILQEAYLQIYNKINTLNEVESFYVWAGRIATNMTYRYIQKNRKELLVSGDEEENEFFFDNVENDDEAFIPETVVENKESQRLIAGIINSLSTEQKLCIQYYYYEEMSVNDIAEAMECSTGTVKSRLNYARKSIKDAVLSLEVNEGTKLYSLAAFPVFALIFRQELSGWLLKAADLVMPFFTSGGVYHAATAAAGGAAIAGGSIGGGAQIAGGSIGGGAQVAGGSIGGSAQVAGGSIGGSAAVTSSAEEAGVSAAAETATAGATATTGTATAGATAATETATAGGTGAAATTATATTTTSTATATTATTATSSTATVGTATTAAAVTATGLSKGVIAAMVVAATVVTGGTVGGIAGIRHYITSQQVAPPAYNPYYLEPEYSEDDDYSENIDGNEQMGVSESDIQERLAALKEKDEQIYTVLNDYIESYEEMKESYRGCLSSEQYDAAQESFFDREDRAIVDEISRAEILVELMKMEPDSPEMQTLYDAYFQKLRGIMEIDNKMASFVKLPLYQQFLGQWTTEQLRGGEGCFFSSAIGNFIVNYEVYDFDGRYRDLLEPANEIKDFVDYVSSRCLAYSDAVYQPEVQRVFNEYASINSLSSFEIANFNEKYNEKMPYYDQTVY